MAAFLDLVFVVHRGERQDLACLVPEQQQVRDVRAVILAVVVGPILGDEGVGRKAGCDALSRPDNSPMVAEGDQIVHM